MGALGIVGGLLLGLCAGILSGLVGIGGGVVIIPALVMFYGMTQHKAQGTSIAILLLPVGALAFWRYWKAGEVDLKLAALVIVGFTVGGWLGGTWAQRIPDLVLRRGFAALLIVLAVRMLFK